MANKTVQGSWTVVAQVASIETFKVPSAKLDPTSVPFTTVTFKDGGETDSPLRIWSGNILMNLARNEALTMTLKAVDGGEYLFVEAGGFSEKSPFGWKSPLLVMKKVQ